MSKKVTYFLLLFFFASATHAKVILPSLFQDNMVLQQQTNVSVWGKATPGSTVIITAGWTKENFAVKVAADSSWATKIPTAVAGGPYTLTFKEKETTTLTNVLLGEVWLCSGQSNMDMQMKGSGSQPVEFSADRILGAKKSIPIRICKINNSFSQVPEETVKCSWKENTGNAVAVTSAVAYFFAETMQRMLDVPIGIIIPSWGGTPIETWMTKEAIEKAAPGEFNFDHLNAEKKVNNPSLPQHIYNGEIAPLIPFTIKGIIWYQGESNRHRYEQYSRLQPAFVEMLREKFQCPDAGFYFVQIAPYIYDNKPNGFIRGYFCEAQESTVKKIPHSAMVTTQDVGEYYTIHPRYKLQVGERLAYLALTKDYGFTSVEAEAPVYKEMTKEGNKIKITFERCPGGLIPYGGPINGFEIAAEDKIFYKAQAVRTSGNTVVVSSEQVQKPVAVRYCFRNYQTGDLCNIFQIPVGPFRTDNWKLE